MDTEMNASKPSIWLELANAQEKVHHLPRQDSSQLTTASSDTDLTHITTTTSSIRTAPRKSTSSSSIQKRESDIRLQYNQRPEKVPDIAAEMEKWYATTDRYGFIKCDQLASSTKAQEKEVERSEKWADMSEVVLLHNDQVHSFPFSHKFKSRVFKGIPYCWKRDAWYFLITHCLKEAKSDYKLCSLYRDLLSKESSHERQIDLDIPRTLGDHIMFKQRYGKGQRALFNVLRAFSKFDEEVGYCQGMTNIVATILMYCEEEKAFVVLVHMFARDELHNLYIPGFPKLMESFYIQEALLKRYLPKLYHHLTDLGLSSDIYSTRWYITLFTGGVVSYHTLMRIWDAYFLCGYDIFFFVAVALLKTHEQDLMEGDLDVCMQTLGSTMTVPDDDQFMKKVHKLWERSQRHHTIETLRKEYKTQHD